MAEAPRHLFTAERSDLRRFVDGAQAVSAAEVRLEVSPASLLATMGHNKAVCEAKAPCTAPAAVTLGLNIAKLQAALRPLKDGPVEVTGQGFTLTFSQGARRVSIGNIEPDQISSPKFPGIRETGDWAAQATLPDPAALLDIIKVAEDLSKEARHFEFVAADGILSAGFAEGYDSASAPIGTATGSARAAYTLDDIKAAARTISFPATLRFSTDYPLLLECPTASFIFAPWIAPEN